MILLGKLTKLWNDGILNSGFGFVGVAAIEDNLLDCFGELLLFPLGIDMRSHLLRLSPFLELSSCGCCCGGG